MAPDPREREATPGEWFTLRAIQFPDSLSAEAEALEAIAADYLDRPIGFGHLNAMLARINGLLRSRGSNAGAAYLSPESLRGSALRIEVVSR